MTTQSDNTDLDSKLDEILQTDENLMDITKPLDDAALMSRSHLKTQIKHLITQARIDELQRLKKIDAFNEAYSTDPRPSRHITIRIAELKAKT